MRLLSWCVCAALLVTAAGASAQDVPVVKNLTTARVQWNVPAADAGKVYFDYWVDLKPFAEAQITRAPDVTIGGVTLAAWQARLPATLTEGRHHLQVRTCRTGAKDPNVDCSNWVAASFDVDADGNVRPSDPTNVTFITVGVTVNVTGRP
jgi:hypothetical protein